MPTYNCEMKGSGATLDAYLNEYHLYSNGGASHSYSANIRAWMDKANTFRIKIATSAKAKEGDTAQFSVFASVTEAGSHRTVAQMSFPGGVDSPGAGALPFDTFGKRLAAGNNLDFICDDPVAIVEKPWKADQRLIVNPRAIYELYAEIQKNFVERNVARIMDFSRARIAFCAKLYDKRPDDYESNVRANLTSTFAGRPNWKIIQQPDQELTVHEFLPNKVVRVLDLHGNPPLRTVADKDGIQFGYDIILAMTAGGLVWIM